MWFVDRFDRNKLFEVGPSNSKDFLYNETSYHEHDASFDCEHSVKAEKLLGLNKVESTN